MNKIDLLKTRRVQLLEVGKEIRGKISELTDEGSFVELDAYSFSRADFYGEDAHGEGVVTGYATIDDNPVYVVAQNSNVLSGGVTEANCKKIKKCLDKALANDVPVVYLFDSKGVVVGEGVNVLDGIASLLAASDSLKGSVPQFSIVLGDLYGSLALLAANADFNFILNGSAVAYASPKVISAKSGKNLSKEEVGGVKSAARNSLSTISAENIADVKAKISEIFSILPMSSDIVVDAKDDLNRTSEKLNEGACPACLFKATFDEGKSVDLNADYCPEVKTAIGRMGGISVACLAFAKDGVYLTSENVAKIKEFVYFAADNGLPLVTFVNTLGIKNDLKTSDSTVMREIAHTISGLRSCDRVSVVYGKAVGLGYSLFASKSMGVDFSYAFADAKISLFDGTESAAAFGTFNYDDIDKLQERYSEENADPINAAKNGYIDNVIEPAFVRAYVVSALQTFARRV